MSKKEFKNRSNVDVVKEAYNAIANYFAPILTIENASQKEIDFMDKFLEFLPQQAVIADLGCGVGKHGRYCAQKGFDVTGYDISDKMIELAERYNHEYAEMAFLKIADICELKCEQRYDAIIAVHSLMHLTEGQMKSTLENLKKYLKNDAVLALTFFLGDRDGYYEEALDTDYWQYFKEYHQTDIKNIIDELGFEILMEETWVDEDEIAASNPDDGIIGFILKYKA